MINFALRNLKIFFRQKTTVFFSLLGVFIILGLYILFLGDVWATGYDLPNMKLLMNTWIIAGIVSVTSITTSMGGFQIMIDDQENKVAKDFFSAPLKRSKIVGGYILSAFLIGVILCLVALGVGELYLVLNGNPMLSLTNIIKSIGVILLSSAASSCFVFFIVSFFKTNSAFSTASTILGTLIGFLTGIYLPIGSLPDAVQWLIKIFPVSHSAVLMRQILMEDAIAVSFKGIPQAALDSFKETVGVTFTYGDTVAQGSLHIIVLVLTTLIFFTLAVYRLSKKKN